MLHLGNNDEKHKYRMWDNWLSDSTAEKDLGVLVDHRLNMSQQCDADAKKVNIFLGYMKLEKMESVRCRSILTG